MIITELQDLILETYSGLILTNTYGEKSFFYNPDNLLPRGIYFATIKEADGPNDKVSNLNREGIFRLNLGISLSSYQKLFASKPKRPLKTKATTQRRNCRYWTRFYKAQLSHSASNLCLAKLGSNSKSRRKSNDSNQGTNGRKLSNSSAKIFT